MITIYIYPTLMSFLALLKIEVVLFGDGAFILALDFLDFTLLVGVGTGLGMSRMTMLGIPFFLHTVLRLVIVDGADLGTSRLLVFRGFEVRLFLEGETKAGSLSSLVVANCRAGCGSMDPGREPAPR